MENSYKKKIYFIFKSVLKAYNKIFEDRNNNRQSKYLLILESILYKKENDIRDILFEYLKLTNPISEDLPYIKIYKEKISNEGNGRYDVVFKYGDWSFIIEAKKLDGSQKLNKEYIENGINRFRGKGKRGNTDYSSDVINNGNVAGMLGFVVGNGVVDDILDSVRNLIISNNIGTVENNDIEDIIDIISKHTYLINNDEQFSLYHKFLDFSNKILNI